MDGNITDVTVEYTSDEVEEAEKAICEAVNGEENADAPNEDENTQEVPEASDELEALRSEVALLKAQLDEERAIYSRMNAECAEFSQLYPSVSISSLSDDIWDSVKRGVPLAAAYALEERRAAVTSIKANAVNSENRRLSSGSVDSSTADEYFSPDEVRAMSPAQVRANYSKIISSMSKWH